MPTVRNRSQEDPLAHKVLANSAVHSGRTMWDENNRIDALGIVLRDHDTCLVPEEVSRGDAVVGMRDVAWVDTVQMIDEERPLDIRGVVDNDLQRRIRVLKKRRAVSYPIGMDCSALCGYGGRVRR